VAHQPVPSSASWRSGRTARQAARDRRPAVVRAGLALEEERVLLREPDLARDGRRELAEPALPALLPRPPGDVDGDATPRGRAALQDRRAELLVLPGRPFRLPRRLTN
jgi:hypothetical protein